VAIKKITKVFRNLGDARRILREMKLLRYFRGFEANIVEILDIMVSPCRRDFEDVYIVTNLMETSLRNVIVSGQPLEDTHYKYFLYQMLRALKLVHSANVSAR
jgi:mitogen-activated protein kinase 1/3